ncbi:unnamed protein product [Effrenium voratum]|nr:unnamed protein product [Effrenium voratum]
MLCHVPYIAEPNATKLPGLWSGMRSRALFIVYSCRGDRRKHATFSLLMRAALSLSICQALETEQGWPWQKHVRAGHAQARKLVWGAGYCHGSASTSALANLHMFASFTTLHAVACSFKPSG